MSVQFGNSNSNAGVSQVKTEEGDRYFQDTDDEHVETEPTMELDENQLRYEDFKDCVTYVVESNRDIEEVELHHVLDEKDPLIY